MTTQSVDIEDFYPYSYTPQSRYGEGKPAHPQIERILAKRLANYEDELRGFSRFVPELLRIGLHRDPSRPNEPNWINGFLPGLDALVVYGMIATRKPRTYCEIGSGNSTCFAELARRMHSPDTQFLSIDPAPRVEIASLCEKVIQAPLQDCDPAMFAALDAGDILFIDGSHRVLQNSDVSVLFLEIFPALKPGVIIHIHDIFWPYDYPSAWKGRMYSEQYMLGTLLIFAEDKFEVLMPNAFISQQPRLMAIFDEVWNAPHLNGIEPHGGSFWMTRK